MTILVQCPDESWVSNYLTEDSVDLIRNNRSALPKMLSWEAVVVLRVQQFCDLPWSED